MIAAGLLPLTSDEDALHRTATHKRGSATAPRPRDEQLRLKAKAPMITQTLLDAQRAAMTADTATPLQQGPMQTAASATADAGQREFEDSAPTARWRQFMKPSEAMANKVAEFEQSSHGFKLAQEQLSACRWFGEAMDLALQDEENQIPLRNRKQQACLLIGAGGTGKTTIVLELMLEVFCHFFPARPGEEERYMIATFSHAQSDAISNDTYRARTCHTACSYRVASLRNKHLALKTKEDEMKRRWQPKIFVIQDEISLVPAAVENMMLYRSMRARQDEGLDPPSYAQPGELMGHIPILLIAGDFLQIKPANEISLADDLEELVRKMPHRVQSEHYAAQSALMSIETVIHLKKSKRFLDEHLPEITAAMRVSSPNAPLSESHLIKLRSRKIENCRKELSTDLFRRGHMVGMYWENIARSMVERAHRDAQELDVPLFCLQAADQRHSRRNKTIDKQLTHQLLTVPNPHRTGKLQGMLLVHENMVVRLADVLAPQLGLVKDKLAVVVKVDLHHADQQRLANLEPGYRQFFPEFMAKGIWVKLLKGKSSPMEDALLQQWQEEFEDAETHAADAKTLFFVELVHAEFKIDLKIGDENEKIEVIRWQFPLVHGMLRTAYSAQGLTLDGGVVLDLRRAGGLEDSDWWLAIYVMLTRARKLESLLLLGFTDQVEELLRKGPPTYLRDLTDKLEAKAASTLERLATWPSYDALHRNWSAYVLRMTSFRMTWLVVAALWDLTGFGRLGLVLSKRVGYVVLMDCNESDGTEKRCENVCKQGFEHMGHSVACASFWKNAETTILEVTLSWLSSSKSGLSDLLQQSLQNLFDNILDMFWHVYFFSRSWQACPAFDHVLACLFFQTHLPGMC